MKSKPRTLRSTIFMSALLLCLGLTVPWFCSSRYRVFVCNSLYQTQHMSIQDWCIHKLIDEAQTKSLSDEERANALTELLHIKVLGKLPSSIYYTFSEMVRDTNHRTAGLALKALVKRGGDVHYDYLTDLSLYQKSQPIMVVAQDADTASAEAAYLALLCMQRTADAELDSESPEAVKLSNDHNRAKKNISALLNRKQSCPPVVAYFEIPRFCDEDYEDSQINRIPLGNANELYLEAFEPGFARQNSDPTRSITALLLPFDEFNEPLKFINYRGILDTLIIQRRAAIYMTGDPLTPYYMLRLQADRALPLSQSLLTSHKDDPNEDYLAIPGYIQAMSQTRRAQWIQHLNKPLNRKKLDEFIVDLFDFVELLESHDAEKIVNKFMSVFGQETRLAEYFWEFSMNRVPVHVHEQIVEVALREMRAGNITPQAGLEIAAFLHYPLTADRRWLRESPILEHALTAPPSPMSCQSKYVDQWLALERKNTVTRILSSATNSGMTLKGLTHVRASTRQLKAAQTKQIRASQIAASQLRAKVSDLIALAVLRVATQESKAPQFNEASLVFFENYDEKSLVAAFKRLDPALLKPLARLNDTFPDRFSYHANWPTALKIKQARMIESQGSIFRDLHDRFYCSMVNIAQCMPPDQFQKFLELIRFDPRAALGISRLNTSTANKRKALAIARDVNPDFAESGIPNVVLDAIAADLGQNSVFFKRNGHLSDDDRDALERYYTLIPTNLENYKRRKDILKTHFPRDPFVILEKSLNALSNSQKAPGETDYFYIPTELLVELFLQQPQAASLYVNELKTKSLSNKIIMLRVLRSIPFASQEAIEPLISMLDSYHKTEQLSAYNELLQTLVEIDRRGKATIPALSKIILDPERSYLYRAMAVCSLRRYYELNNIESVLTDLQAKLQGDLKILTDRSLERVRKLRAEDVLPYTKLSATPVKQSQ